MDGGAPGGSGRPRVTTVPSQRRAPAAEVVAARDPDADVYADGSALSRYIPAAPEAPAWRAWATEHEPAVVVSQVAVLEARVTAGFLGIDAGLVVLDALTRLPRMRLSDQALTHAVPLLPGLGAFAALHVGAALAHRDVRAIATYDVPTARAAAEAGLAVVSPGRPDGWWRAG